MSAPATAVDRFADEDRREVLADLRRDIMLELEPRTAPLAYQVASGLRRWHRYKSTPASTSDVERTLAALTAEGLVEFTQRPDSLMGYRITDAGIEHRKQRYGAQR